MTALSLGKASHHASPLRYPGGKGKLAPYLKGIVRSNRLLDCTYIEPFAGGAGAGLLLLLHGYVKKVIINDLSNPVFQFWRAVLDDPEKFKQKISDVELSVSEWKRQRDIFIHQDGNSDFDLGFATFYLNRTNRSGVLNGGMIGGHAQTSAYGIDARFNRRELVARIHRISKHKSRIEASRIDAVSLLQKLGSSEIETPTFLYIDPPYFRKGRDLYYDYYKSDDHQNLRNAVKCLPDTVHWIVSYDNEPEIRALYSEFHSVEYDLSYSVKNGRTGREVMFFSNNLIAASPPN